jgi:AraC-like DNA-binding protein
MLNVYDSIRANPKYSKLEIGEFLFAEYTCGVNAKKLPAWTEKDYFVHVVTGKKSWHTSDGVWIANPGETLFFRKGGTIVEQHFESDVCLLMLFIPDPLMRSTVRELIGSLEVTAGAGETFDAAVRVEHDVALDALFQSMRMYLAAKTRPAEPLLRLKIKELVTSIFTSGMNQQLASYFKHVGAGDSPSIRDVMEANFRFNLSLEEYAKLSHRSLSSFKRDFQSEFQASPGRWLLQRRLDHAANLLRNSELNVTEISFESGFEDVSHFSRAFKERFDGSPVSFRKEILIAA